MSERPSILGLSFDPISREQLEERVVEGIRRGIGAWVLTANLEHLRQYADDAEIRRLLDRADLVVADGTPIVWASRLARRSLPERVAGSDLIRTLPERLSPTGGSVFLLGGAPGAADEAARRLSAANPGLRIAGTACPPLGFDSSPAALSSTIADLRSADPDVVFLGLNFPKQERFIEAARASLPRAWFIGVGISIEFVAGYVKRAPAWTHRAGLEWLYRLTQEPAKLYRRYLVDGLPFALRLARWALGARAESIRVRN